MSLGQLVLVAVGGGFGALTRFAADAWLRPNFRSPLPWSTMIINVSGSLVLGLVTGATLFGPLSGVLSSVLATGFLGGFTTLSTASVETDVLIRGRRYGAAVTYALGTLALSVAAAGIALGLSHLLWS